LAWKTCGGVNCIVGLTADEGEAPTIDDLQL
jgi:hypothetical protein